MYIGLLYKHAYEKKLPFHIVFVLNPEIKRKLSLEENIELLPVKNVIDLIILSDDEVIASTQKIFLIRIINQWNLMKKFMKKTKADHGYFLHIDHVQLLLALRFPFVTGKKLSGLLFRPSIHDIYQDNLMSLTKKIRYYNKKILYRLTLKNNDLSFIHTLDPYFKDFAQQKFSKGMKVHYLPDPSPYPRNNICSNNDESIFFKHIKSYGSRKIFLLFGGLAERKGILKVIDALKYIEEQYTKQIVVVFAGRIDTKIKATFYDKIDKYNKETKNKIPILVEERFIETNELACLLTCCDVVLAPYQRFVGSSGVLAWAVGAKKPIITQDYGLIGYQVRKYKLGIAVDTYNAKPISAGIQQMLMNYDDYALNTRGMNEFYDKCSPDNFTKTFFKDICKNI